MLVMYLFLGVLAGILSGLLGIGGGVIVVPGLVFIFSHRGDIPAEMIMHLAVGTSLSIVMLTCASSANAFWRRDLISWSLFYRFIPGLLAGVLLGSIIAQHISNHHLRGSFAVFLILVAVPLMFFSRISSEKKSLLFCNRWLFALLSILTGSLSAFFGLGGGVIMVPIFLAMGFPLLVSAGTSAACGLPVAIVGSICLMTAGVFSTDATHLPAWATGYVFWPAVIMVACSSMLFAPIGTRLAVHCKTNTLKVIFSVMLLVIAGLMI